MENLHNSDILYSTKIEDNGVLMYNWPNVGIYSDVKVGFGLKALTPIKAHTYIPYGGKRISKANFLALIRQKKRNLIDYVIGKICEHVFYLDLHV